MHENTLSTDPGPNPEPHPRPDPEPHGGTGAPAAPVERHGGTLVVFEGSRRLLWSRPSPGRWRSVGIWPGPAEAAALTARLAARRNTLVVLSHADSSVPLLAEELAEAPPCVRRLARDAAQQADGGPYDIGIPVLDWLPEPLRRRGLEWLRAGAQLAARTPAPLLPPLLVDAPAPERRHLRFALRTGHAGVSPAGLAELVGTLFADPAR